MDCRYVQSRFTGYTDGDLRPAERRCLEQHMSECPACREELAELRRFVSDCHEFLVHPGPAYSFEAIRARMAAIEPLQEIVAFLPRLRVNGLIPRLAVAMLVVLFVSGTPFSLRNTRQVYTAVKLSFASHAEQWDEKYQQQMDREYRDRIEELERGAHPIA